jgi:hypothetical protein
MDCAPAKSTAGDGLRNRNEEVFREFYFKLIDYFQLVLSVSRVKGVPFEAFYAFDSTTLSLFSQVRKLFQRFMNARRKTWQTVKKRA